MVTETASNPLKEWKELRQDREGRKVRRSEGRKEIRKKNIWSKLSGF